MADLNVNVRSLNTAIMVLGIGFLAGAVFALIEIYALPFAPGIAKAA